MCGIKSTLCVTIAILCQCCFIHTAFAQKDTSLVHKTIETEEVTVEAKRQSQEQFSRTLSSIQIGKEFILQQQGNTLMNSLEVLPGISAIHTGVGISKPVIRGMSFNRVIVSQFGLKQEGQQWGADHGLEIDQHNVENIEIVKGPASILYGSDGLGGVISIRKPEIHDSIFRAGVLGSYRSNNDNLGTSIQAEMARNGNWFKTRVSHQQYADYRVPATEFTYNRYKLPIYDRRLKNTAGKETDYAFSIGVKRKKFQSGLHFTFFDQHQGFFAGAMGIPRAYQLGSDGNVRDIQLPNQKIRHLKLVSNTIIRFPRSKCEIDVGYQRNHREESSPAHAHGISVPTHDHKALGLVLQTVSYQVKNWRSLGHSWSVTLGSNGHYQTNERSGFEFLIPNFQSYQAGAYGLVQFEPNARFLALAGLRGDFARLYAERTFQNAYANGQYVGIAQRSPTINRHYALPSGTLGLSYFLFPQVQLKYNAGTAFRVPTIAELASNGVHHGNFRHEMGDSTLQPEQGLMQDLSLSFTSKRFTLMASPFYYYFSNYLYLRPSGRFSTLPDAGQIYQYQQGRTEMKGFEAQLEYRITKGLSYQTNAEYVWNENLNLGIPLPFTPPFSWLNEWKFEQVLGRKKSKTLHASISAHSFAAQNRTDRNEPITDGYLLLNFSAGATIKMGKQELILRFQVRNLNDQKYLNNMSRYRILNLPEQGRNFQIMTILSI
jgi:iron complex outermembrane recepter protein